MRRTRPRISAHCALTDLRIAALSDPESSSDEQIPAQRKGKGKQPKVQEKADNEEEDDDEEGGPDE